MGDYLSELATKNIGTAEVIQPRRAARFEPLQTPYEAQTEALFFQSENFDLEPSFEDDRSEIKPDLPPRRTRLSREDELISSREDELMPNRDDSDEQIPQTRLVSPAKARSQIANQTREPIPVSSKLIEEVRETISEILPSPTIVAPKKSLLTSGEQNPQTQIVSPAKTHSPITEQIDKSISIQTKMLEEARETTNEILPSPRPASPASVTPKKSLLTSGDTHEETKAAAGHVSIRPRFEPKTVELKMPETKSSEPPVIERKSDEAQAPIIAKPRVSKAENYFEELTANQTKILPPREKMLKQIGESAQASNVPVINVTIGRVEVRAVVSSVPVKETRAKPPTLGLDEYLRQRRSGGER